MRVCFGTLHGIGEGLRVLFCVVLFGRKEEKKRGKIILLLPFVIHCYYYDEQDGLAFNFFLSLKYHTNFLFC